MITPTPPRVTLPVQLSYCRRPLALQACAHHDPALGGHSLPCVHFLFSVVPEAVLLPQLASRAEAVGARVERGVRPAE
eukprot:626380-Prymnesium_polylepis.1